MRRFQVIHVAGDTPYECGRQYGQQAQEKIRAGVEEVTDKLRDKLLMCRRVAAERSPFVITQSDVVLRMEKPEEDDR